MEKYYDLGVYRKADECPVNAAFITNVKHVKDIPAGWKQIDALPEGERLYPNTYTADYIGNSGLYTHCDQIKFDYFRAAHKNANARGFEYIMRNNVFVACHAVFCKTYFVLEHEEDDVVESNTQFHFYAAVEEWYCNPNWIFPGSPISISKYQERHPEAVIFERSEFPYEVYWSDEVYTLRCENEIKAYNENEEE